MTDEMVRASASAPPWEALGSVAVASLADVRLQLHHAAQVIVSAAISYLAPRPDDSHTNLEWLPDLHVLATNPVGDANRLRFALRPGDLSLIALHDGAAGVVFPLAGRTVEQAVQWLAGALRQAGLDPARLTMRKHYEIPAHAVGAGAPFGADAAGLAELARWYHDVWLVARAIAGAEPGASPPRCWPHHFDLATLITLPAASDGATRTIGVGGSPGDASYAEPYLYVGPWPYPPSASLPALSHGRWHTVGWTGAVCPWADLAARSDGPLQSRAALAFAREAVAACRALLLPGL